MKKLFLDWHTMTWPRISWKKVTLHKILHRLTHILTLTLTFTGLVALQWEVVGDWLTWAQVKYFQKKNKCHAARRKTTKWWNTGQIRNVQVNYTMYYWQLKIQFCAKISKAQIAYLKMKMNILLKHYGYCTFKLLTLHSLIHIKFSLCGNRHLEKHLNPASLLNCSVG